MAILTLLACNETKKAVEKTPDIVIENKEVSIAVKALDLGEDKGALSTKDDEIIMLIYEVGKDDHIGEPLVKISHRFTPEKRDANFDWPNADEYEGKKIMIVLIEQDSDKGIEQIDPVVRVYADQMIQALAVREYTKIEKYLEDDDLLGIKVIENFSVASSKLVAFSGVYLFDHYEYQIRFLEDN